MKYYAGLDVAMKETHICVVDEAGERVYESKAFTDPQPIYEELKRSGVNLEKVGIEAGSISGYLTKGLQDLSLNAICIDARKMAAILAVTVNKTDRNDARGIADAMRCNHYKPANVRDMGSRSLGILLSSRSTLVASRRTLKNTIRGFLKAYGIRLGSVSNETFPKKFRELLNIPQEAKFGLEGLMKSYEAIFDEIKKIEKFLNKICQQDKQAKNLMTIPGVGMIVAMTYKADIGDPARFKKSEAVGAYYGMTPRQYSSGDTVRLGGISKCGSKEVRTLLIEAAVTLITRSKAWNPLKAWGMKLCKKYGLKKAAVAVGRKLSIIMHRMLFTGESFRYKESEKVTAA